MATIEDVSLAVLVYKQARTDNATQETAAFAALGAFEATLAAEQAVVDAALAEQTLRVAEAQAALDVAYLARDAAFVAMLGAQDALVETVAAYDPPPEP
jgi:hypothetical protein